MHEKVDQLVNVAKAIIDVSPMQKETKEWSKLGIDFAVTTYKRQLEEEIAHIREVAQLHNLDRVVAFSCTIEGKQQTALRLYGGDMPAFCRDLGATLLTDDNLHAEPAYIDRMVQQNGTVIYERK